LRVRQPRKCLVPPNLGCCVDGPLVPRSGYWKFNRIAFGDEPIPAMLSGCRDRSRKRPAGNHCRHHEAELQTIRSIHRGSLNPRIVDAGDSFLNRWIIGPASLPIDLESDGCELDVAICEFKFQWNSIVRPRIAFDRSRSLSPKGPNIGQSAAFPLDYLGHHSINLEYLGDI
jgi:hypothetical protein